MLHVGFQSERPNLHWLDQQLNVVDRPAVAVRSEIPSQGPWELVVASCGVLAITDAVRHQTVMSHQSQTSQLSVMLCDALRLQSHSQLPVLLSISDVCDA